MEKFTKIIATIGPASDSKEKLGELIENGVNVIRFNFKHSTTDWHRERLQKLKEVCLEKSLQVATLLDLQGPEIRITMPFEKIHIDEGEKIILSDDVFDTKQKGFTFKTKGIIEHLNQNQQVSVDDGLFEFTVIKEDEKTFLLSYSTGDLFNNKSVSIAGLTFDFPTIHDKDREGLVLAKEEGIDFIALSFVRNAKDIQILREEMKKINLDAKIVAKIETELATQNIEEIIEYSDAIMVARGDLGVELPLEQVPYLQKKIIKLCLQKGVPVITATQMLESMTDNPIPTRAEVSDVANAVYDFTGTVMLSGETANGKYPIEAVKTMSKIIKFSESKTHLNDIRNLFDYELTDNSQMVCDSAFNLYKSLKAKNKKIKGFLIFTESGKTSRMLSRYRPHVPIYTFCTNEDLTKKLLISYGVKPIFQKSLKDKDEIIQSDIKNAFNLLIENKESEKGDTFIVIHGDYWTSKEGASTIRLVTL